MDKRRRAAAAGHAWQIYSDTQRPGTPGLFARLKATPRMVRDTFRGDYKGLGTAKLALLVFGLVYIVSPIDAVPDFIPFIGVADDLGVAMWLLATLVAAAGEYVDWHRTRPDLVQGHVVG